MRRPYPGGCMKTGWQILSLILLVISGVHAGNRNTYPIPEERGTAGILAALGRLPVNLRVLQITAHPDDESAGTLTWLSRKVHAKTALFCLTRGEGGQNILGDEKYGALGLVRTGELLEASRHYGNELYFGKAIDFGFSKTAEETLRMWGHEPTLGDLVRFIRQWRPTIIISRFGGGPADGHGHHQAAGILAKEAFRAAADPERFPDQLRDGLQVWQAAKLYVSSFGLSPGAVSVPAGEYDPVLGRSYREIGAEGYSSHRSQGNAMSYSFPGGSGEHFILQDSAAILPEKEEGLFDNLDISIRSIRDLAGKEKDAVAFLADDLAAVEETALSALQGFKPFSPELSAPAVSRGIVLLTESIRKVRQSRISHSARERILDALENKRDDFQDALTAVLGIHLLATTRNATAVPGDTEPVTVHFWNRGRENVALKYVRLEAPGKVVPEQTNPPFGTQPSGSAALYNYSIEISPEAPPTEPFWDHPHPLEARYAVGETENEFAPFGRPEITAEAVYGYDGAEVSLRAIARAQAGSALRGSDFVEFQVVPAVSVSIEPEFTIVPAGGEQRVCEFRVSVLNNRIGGINGTVQLVADNMWQIRPPRIEFRLSRKGETSTAGFAVHLPAKAASGAFPVTAVATANGIEYRRGFRGVSYPENWTRNYYRPAQSQIRRFDIKTVPGLTVGYIPGAGDDVPAALGLLGIKVEILSGERLSFGELDRYDAIVTGIRAYNVNEDLRANNQRLLDYVYKGGTLIVQYVRPERTGRGDGSVFPYGPHAMTISSSSRITVEDSPLEILDPSHPVFNRPNRITDADFQGWVQERGLYFMNSWDSKYSPLLSGNDPGEEAQNGGMLYARHGKGHYLYTGYSWFRQLPAGVPGAFRIFANMISLGHREVQNEN